MALRFEEKLEPVITELMQAAAKEQGIRIWELGYQKSFPS